MCLRTARARAQPSQVVGWRRPGLAAVSHHTVRKADGRQGRLEAGRGDTQGARPGTMQRRCRWHTYWHTPAVWVHDGERVVDAKSARSRKLTAVR